MTGTELVRLQSERFCLDGTCHAFHGQKHCKLYNALPGELIAARPTKKKKGILHFIAEEIISPSSFRIEALENHHRSCSPWQILDIAYEHEVKAAMMRQLLQRELNFDPPNYTFHPALTPYGYRNKMEFSFMDIGGKPSLAFFRRDGLGKVPLTGCCLANEHINEAARDIMDTLRDRGIAALDLKSLIIRTAAGGQVVAALFVKNRNLVPIVPLSERLQGFVCCYSDPKSPASVVTEILSSEGSLVLVDTVLDTPLRYGVFNFFQVNLPLFEIALQAIKPWLCGLPALDFYSGVGTIGITLRHSLPSCISAESDSEAIKYAKFNGQNNACRDFIFLNAPAEHLLDKLAAQQILILDPPRGGLHPKLLKRVQKAMPQRIAYLACNPASQLRDIKLLTSCYSVAHAEAFNFFPRTPHIESLVILDAKKPTSTLKPEAILLDS